MEAFLASFEERKYPLKEEYFPPLAIQATQRHSFNSSEKKGTSKYFFIFLPSGEDIMTYDMNIFSQILLCLALLLKEDLINRCVNERVSVGRQSQAKNPLQGVSDWLRSKCLEGLSWPSCLED